MSGTFVLENDSIFLTTTMKSLDKMAVTLYTSYSSLFRTNSF